MAVIVARRPPVVAAGGPVTNLLTLTASETAAALLANLSSKPIRATETAAVQAPRQTAKRIGVTSINPDWTPVGTGAWLLSNVNLTASDADWTTRESELGRRYAGKMKYKAVNTTTLADMNVGDPFASVAYPTVGSFPRATNAIYAINAGTYDAQLIAFANAVTAIAPTRVFLRLFWEFNLHGATTNGAYNPINYTDAAGAALPGTWTDFQTAWIRVWTIFFGTAADFTAHGITGTPPACSPSQVKFAYSPNRRTSTGGTAPDDPTLGYPGSQYVDWIMIDTYPSRQLASGESMESPDVLMGLAPSGGTDWYQTFSTYGKPMGIGETSVHPVDDVTTANSGYIATGSVSPLTRVEWWSRWVASLQAHPLVRMVTIFDANDGTWPTSGHTWQTDAASSTANDSGAQAFAAYEAFVDDPYLNPSAAIQETATAASQRRPGKLLAASETAAATLPRRVGKILAAAEAGSATVARRVAKAITATASAVAAIQKQVAKLAAASEAATVTLGRIKATLLLLTTSSSATTLVQKQTAKQLAASETATAVTSRRTGKTMLVSETATVVARRLVGKLRAVTETAAATLGRIKSVSMLLAAASTAATTIQRRTDKALAASNTAVTVAARRTGKTLAASETAVVVAARRSSRALSATSIGAAAVAKRIAKTVAATETSAVTLITAFISVVTHVTRAFYGFVTGLGDRGQPSQMGDTAAPAQTGHVARASQTGGGGAPGQTGASGQVNL